MSRSIPFSEEAERGIIGCCLTDPKTLDDAIGHGVTPDWFHDVRLRELWNTLNSMQEERMAIDMITVINRLKERKLLEMVGGMTFVSELMDSIPSAVNLPYYVDIARDKYRRRRMLDIACEAVNTVQTSADKADTLLDIFEAKWMGIREEHSVDNDLNGKQLASKAFDLLQDRCSGNTDAIPTGWSFMDRILRGGLRAGQVFVIAGRPGSGKTAFTLSLLSSLVSAGIPCGFISLEMSAEEVGMRLIAVESQVDVGRYDKYTPPTEGEMRKLQVATSRMVKHKLLCNDRPNQTPQSIAAKARRWVRNSGMKVLAIDYLQLISGGEGKERREHIDAISRSVKLLAKELKIPVLLLAQLNRSIERDGNRKPRLSDLRESGAIEQDADVVGMLYRDSDGQQDDTRQDGPVRVNLLIAKQRAGPAGVDVRFIFRPEITRFDPQSPIDS